MAIFDVVRFDGLRSREWLIYKYPSDSLVLGSQLIVQEGQAVIFVKGGEVCDVFYPGTYTLSTNNLPILQSLINLPFGGKTPFSAEVYFLNTTTKLNLNWGTTDPIQIIDPKYHVKMRVRAFGQIGLKLADYGTFFRELIGGMQQSDLVKFDKIVAFYRGILILKIKAILAETILSRQISVLEIASMLETLSEEMQQRVAPEFARYGFTVTNLYIQSINFPDEDFERINQILEDKAAFEIMGDRRYATKRSFDIYEGAANNSNGVAGAFVAGGMGLGAAVGVGQAMRDTVGTPMESAGSSDVRECPGCHAQVPAGAKFCSQCGFSLKDLVCSCGATLPPGAKFCPECGKKVGS